MFGEAKDSVLLVVDVQNDFCHPEGLFAKAGLELTGIQASVGKLLPLIDIARSSGLHCNFREDLSRCLEQFAQFH